MFQATTSIFEAWLRTTFGSAAMPIATGVVLGVIVAAGSQIMMTAAGPDAVVEISLILSVLTIMFLSVGVMLAIPSAAQNVTGAIGLASNAAGLMGLAREGMVRSSAGAALTTGHVGGAAIRLATGHSPRELLGAARHGTSEGWRHARGGAA